MNIYKACWHNWMEVALEVCRAGTKMQQSGYIRNNKANMLRRLVLIITISFMSMDQQQNFDKQKSSDSSF